MILVLFSTNFIRFLTRVEEDEEKYVRGWLNNNKLLGPFESSKPRGVTVAVGSSSSRKGQVPEQGLTTLLRAKQQVYGMKAKVKLYFEEYRDMMMKAACPPLHLYGAKGLKRQLGRGGSHQPSAEPYSSSSTTSTTPTTQYEHISSLRDIIDEPTNAPLLQQITHFLSHDMHPSLQHEAVGIVQHLLASPMTPPHTEFLRKLLEKMSSQTSGLKALVHLLWLPSPKEHLRESAAWCVGYIASASVENRDKCLETALPALVDIVKSLSPQADMSYLQALIFALSQLALGNPDKYFDDFRSTLSGVCLWFGMNDNSHLLLLTQPYNVYPSPHPDLAFYLTHPSPSITSIQYLLHLLIALTR